ncbi:hypothetical protein WBG99_21500 [Streptomyces sp. TG1A-60]|uniref:hypothetical protein n=1 Tax=Streptomyces sp. TG1A-60 TaxID=3129111 RepID=UPI0030CB14A2
MSLRLVAAGGGLYGAGAGRPDRWRRPVEASGDHSVAAGGDIADAVTGQICDAPVIQPAPSARSRRGRSTHARADGTPRSPGVLTALDEAPDTPATVDE